MRYDHIQEFNTNLMNSLPMIDTMIARYRAELDRLTRYRTLVAQFASAEVQAEPAAAASQSAVAAALESVITASPTSLANDTAITTATHGGSLPVDDQTAPIQSAA